MSQKSPYKVAVIFLQPECNMSCTFCITEDNFDVLSEDQAISLLNSLKDQGFESVVLGGGEPLTWHGNLLRVCQEAKKLDLIVQIGTNGIALPPGFAKIKDIDRFVIPLESTDADIHNKMRHYNNTHHLIILKALLSLRLARKSTTISTIITQINKDGIKDLGMYLKQLNETSPFIHAWHLYKFIPEGRGGRTNADLLNVSDEEYTLACRTAKSLGLDFPVYRRENMYRSSTVDFFWSQGGKIIRTSDGTPAPSMAKHLHNQD